MPPGEPEFPPAARALDFGDVPDVLGAASARSAPSAALPASGLLGPVETRARVQRRRFLALAAAAAWACAELAAFGVRSDFERLPASYVGLTLIAPLAVGVLGLWTAVAPGRHGLGAKPSTLLALAILGPLSVMATALLLPAPYAGGVAGDEHAIFMCGHIALAWAAVPLVCAVLALRRGFAAGANWRSALVGTACGLGAAVAAQLRCPLTGAAHVAIAHGGVVVLSGLVGALVLPLSTRA